MRASFRPRHWKIEVVFWICNVDFFRSLSTVFVERKRWRFIYWFLHVFFLCSEIKSNRRFRRNMRFVCTLPKMIRLLRNVWSYYIKSWLIVFFFKQIVLNVPPMKAAHVFFNQTNAFSIKKLNTYFYRNIALYALWLMIFFCRRNYAYELLFCNKTRTRSKSTDVTTRKWSKIIGIRYYVIYK